MGEKIFKGMHDYLFCHDFLFNCLLKIIIQNNPDLDII